MDIMTETQMDGLTPEEQAKRAIYHVLGQIHCNKKIRDQMGFGSESFNLLTEAASSLYGQPLEEIRKQFCNGKE